MWTKCNDLVLNVETIPPDVGWDSSRPWWPNDVASKAAHADNLSYSAVDYFVIRKIAKLLKPKHSDVIYDLGSGMGRIVCVMARYDIRESVGIELSESLCKIARLNAERLRLRKAPIRIICGDCATTDFSDGTIFFLFNPFGLNTMTDVVAHLRASLSKNQRRITIVYYNSVHRVLFESCDWLFKSHEFKTLTKRIVTIWTTRGSGTQ